MAAAGGGGGHDDLNKHQANGAGGQCLGVGIDTAGNSCQRVFIQKQVIYQYMNNE